MLETILNIGSIHSIDGVSACGEYFSRSVALY
jgi:hypothetical protein